VFGSLESGIWVLFMAVHYKNRTSCTRIVARHQFAYFTFRLSNMLPDGHKIEGRKFISLPLIFAVYLTLSVGRMLSLSIF
jgi:hypothetical protein